MRVLLATSWNDKCGIAEYARNLTTSAKKADSSIDFVILDPSKFRHMQMAATDCQIIHLNCEMGLFRQFPWQDLRWAKARGKKVLMTMHNTHYGNNRNAYTRECHAVVAHERTRDGFWFIPMGVPDYVPPDGLVIKNQVGSFGFPFGKKGFVAAASIAYQLGLGFHAMMARSRHVDVDWAMGEIRGVHPLATFDTEWLPESVIIDTLARNLVNVYPYITNDNAISAAVRLAIAARRPLVVTRDHQFNDLFEYEDEIYVAPPTEVLGTVRQAVGDWNNGTAKIPRRVIEATCWSKVGGMYVQAYKRLLGS